MQGPGLFSATEFCYINPTTWNSVPADLADNFNNMLLSGFIHKSDDAFYTVSLTASALVLNYHLNLVLLRLSSIPPAPSELSSSGTITSSISRITPVRTQNRLSV